MSGTMDLWRAQEAVAIPPGTDTPEALAKFARQLTVRDKEQIVHAFAAQHYEMVTSFVWSKAMASLKRRLESLGSEFVGEMLDRPDIKAGANLAIVLTDNDALRLAEELGMFSSGEAMRLRHSMEVVLYFAEPPPDFDGDGIQREEAISCFRNSIKSVLGHDRLEVAVEFATFRKRLEEEVFTAESDEVVRLATVPYFFRRTTLRVLMALVKSGTGVQLDHALGNFQVIVQALWKGLLKPDRWDVGRTYAEVHNSGQTTAAAAIQRALLRVQGFDYVPENLRSLTFIAAANKVLEVHFASSNFYNEPAPMRTLAALGSVIPTPALSKCMTAILCVKLGNPYGTCWAAQPSANTLLDNLSTDQWSYYLNECLPADREILDKLQSGLPRANWISMVKTRGLGNMDVSNESVRRLIAACVAGNGDAVSREAIRLRGK